MATFNMIGLALSGSTGTGTFVGSNNATLVAPVLGTPASGNLSNCTDYPISAITGLGTNVATWLATPSSANLAAAVTDETGSGALVFATSPTLVTPALGTPSACVLTNATDLPVSGLADGTPGEIITWDNTNAPATVSTGTAGQVLTSNGAGLAPTFQASAGSGTVNSGTEYQLAHYAATGTAVSELGSTGNTGQVLTSNGVGAAPTWENTSITPGASGLIGFAAFNGTGTVAILGSENVTSITDNGTGLYTANWTTPFVGATYSVTTTAYTPSSNAMLSDISSTGVSAGAAPIRTYTQTVTLTDSAYVCINAVGTKAELISATGGSESSSGGYRIHTFTSDGTFTITSGYDNVEYLVVAGGGGGGRDNFVGGRAAGGGGAGAMLTGTVARGAGAYTVTVGAGGAGGNSGAGTACNGVNGQNSVFDTITATGGGGGGGHSTTTQYTGAAGGSGGGGCSGAAGGAGTTGGNNGGAGAGTTAGGGGGGAGAVGAAGSGSTGGAGGAGTASSISGGSVTYAGGGGGHANTTGGAGGAGGGGAGASGTGAGVAGTANTGGGGGGSRGSDGGAGGSGIVIVRYAE